MAHDHLNSSALSSVSVERLVRRLKRDSPEIAAELARGELPSAQWSQVEPPPWDRVSPRSLMTWEFPTSSVEAKNATFSAARLERPTPTCEFSTSAFSRQFLAPHGGG